MGARIELLRVERPRFQNPKRKRGRNVRAAQAPTLPLLAPRILNALARAAGSDAQKRQLSLTVATRISCTVTRRNTGSSRRPAAGYSVRSRSAETVGT